MRKGWIAASTLLLALGLAACGGGGGGPSDTGTGGDSGTGTDVVRNDTGAGTDSGTTTDVANRDTGTGTDVVSNRDTGTGTDVVMSGDAGPPLFGACSVTADCGGATGTACLNAWPGGICTKQCANDRACGNNGICFQNICVPRCTPTQFAADGTISTPGGGECAGHGELCFQVDQLDPTRGACFPSCNTPMDPGVAACPASASMCDLYSGSCIDPAMPNTGTGDNGAPCMNDAMMMNTCKGGRCIDATSMGTPTGFVGGYCFSVGIQLDINDYMGNMPIPRSNCPTGSVMLPADPSQALAGDPAICWKGCSANSDCRGGYECFEFPQPDAGNFFTSGACLPINCMSPTWTGQPNHGCPTGSTCMDQTGDSGTPSGICG